MTAFTRKAEPSAVKRPLELKYGYFVHFVTAFLCRVKRHREGPPRTTEVQAAAARVLPRFVEVVLLVLGHDVVLVLPLAAAATSTAQLTAPPTTEGKSK